MSIARTNATGGEGMLHDLVEWSSSLLLDRLLAREDVIGSAAHGLHERIQIKRFWQIVIGAKLSGANGGHDCILGAHHNDGYLGARFFNAR